MKDKSKIKKKKINFDEPPVDDILSDAEVVETTATAVVEEIPLAHSAIDSREESPSYPDENADAFSDQMKEKVKINFPFSEIVRAKIPKVFDVAETAATQWKHNEKFENLGVPHPVGEIALAKALEKAKEVEKKLEEKGVISAAKMGIAVAEYQVKDILKKLKKNE